MKVKTMRCHYDEHEYRNERSLEDTINEIGYENILNVLPTYYGCGEVAYTIIYKESEENK